MTLKLISAYRLVCYQISFLSSPLLRKTMNNVLPAVEFIQQLFGRSGYLRAQGRITPISDTFLVAFVTLLDVLANKRFA